MKDYLKLVLPWLVLSAFPVLGQPTSNTTYSATLVWDASPDTNAVGYAVYTWTNSFYSGTNQLSHWTNSGIITVIAGTNLTATVTNLALGVTYYAVATAYTVSGIESDYSNQATWIQNKPTPPHLRVNVKLQASASVLGPWAEIADMGDVEVDETTPFYRGFLTIH